MEEFFLKMIWWNGDVAMLEEAKKYAFNSELIQIIEYLESLYKNLSSLGYKDIVTFDLGKIGNLNYYTGIIFDAFVEGVGLRILSGGRYDNLLKKYGVDLPAVGFSIKLDQLMNAYDYKDTSKEIIVEYGKGNVLEAIKKRNEFDDSYTVILKENNTIDGINVLGGSL
jgi:ATP phosphoribosyltransferase regulatory subunit